MLNWLCFSRNKKYIQTFRINITMDSVGNLDGTLGLGLEYTKIAVLDPAIHYYDYKTDLNSTQQLS